MLSLHTPIPGEDTACPECPQLTKGQILLSGSCWSKIQQWELRLRMLAPAEVPVHELFDTCPLLNIPLSTAANPATAQLLKHKLNSSNPFISLSPLPASQIYFFLLFECSWVHLTVAEVLPSLPSPHGSACCSPSAGERLHRCAHSSPDVQGTLPGW